MKKRPLDGGQLRLKLTPDLAEALGRKPGWFVIRVSERTKEKLDVVRTLRCVKAGIQVESVSLGSVAIWHLERALNRGHLKANRSAAESVRIAISRTML